MRDWLPTRNPTGYIAGLVAAIIVSVLSQLEVINGAVCSVAPMVP